MLHFLITWRERSAVGLLQHCLPQKCPLLLGMKNCIADQLLCLCFPASLAGIHYFPCWLPHCLLRCYQLCGMFCKIGNCIPDQLMNSHFLASLAGKKERKNAYFDWFVAIAFYWLRVQGCHLGPGNSLATMRLSPSYYETKPPSLTPEIIFVPQLLFYYPHVLEKSMTTLRVPYFFNIFSQFLLSKISYLYIVEHIDFMIPTIYK